MRTKNVRRTLGVVTALLLAISVTGCRTYDEFAVRAPAAGPVAFRHLASGGGHVVVQATAADGTVPGAGWWRVDRTTGDVEALPGAVARISADGSRVLLDDGRLWRAGQPIVTATGAYSDDLRHRFGLVGGALTVTDVATGATVDVDAAHPRPAGAGVVVPVAVSDDGQTVQFEAHGTAKVIRTVRLGSDPVDLSIDPQATEWSMLRFEHRLSADGRTIARMEVVQLPMEVAGMWVAVDHAATVQLVDVLTGTVRSSGTWERTPGSSTTFTLRAIARNGSIVWLTQTALETSRGLWCGGSATPNTCPTETLVRALRSDGGDLLVDLGWAAGRGWLVRSFDAPSSASFAVVGLGLNGPTGTLPQTGPVVLHATRGQVDVLEQTEDGAGPAHRAQMSDDGRLIAASGPGDQGWYEFADPADETD